MLDKLKNYPIYITPKATTGERQFFEPQPFLRNKKIVGIQIFSGDILSTNPEGSTLGSSTYQRVNLYMPDVNNNVIINEIPAFVFLQIPTASVASGGNLVRFKPFIPYWQKSYLLTTAPLNGTDAIGLNFYYL